MRTRKSAVFGKFRDRCAGPFLPLSTAARSHASSRPLRRQATLVPPSASPAPSRSTDRSRSRLTWGQQNPETDAVIVRVVRVVVPAVR